MSAPITAWRAFDLVRQRLADVVHQRRAARELLVEAELGGHHAGEEPRLDRVQPLVLRVARAEVERADELDDLGMRLLDAERLERLLAERADLLIEVLARLASPTPRDALRASSIVSGFLIMRPSARRTNSLPTPSRPSSRIASLSSLTCSWTPATRSSAPWIARAVVEQDRDEIGADAQGRQVALGQEVML